MASTVVRFAFAFFVLACVGTAAWSTEEEAATPTEQRIAETWIPAICSAWSEYHEEARERAACARGAARVETSEASGAACSSAYTARDGDFCRRDAAGPSEAPFRR